MAAFMGVLRKAIAIIFVMIAVLLAEPEPTENRVVKPKVSTMLRRSRRTVTIGTKTPGWWAIVRNTGLQIRRGNSRRVLTWVISREGKVLLELSEAGNTWHPAPNDPKPRKEAAMPDGSMHVDSCQVSTAATVESNLVTYEGNATMACMAIAFAFLVFGLGEHGIAAAGMVPFLSSSKKRGPANEKFSQWLNGIRKDSPLKDLVSTLDTTVVISKGDEDSIPDGYVKILTLTKTSWLYGSGEAWEALVRRIHVTTKATSTLGKIAKYVGSLVTAQKTAWVPVEGRAIVTMEEVTPSVEGEPHHHAVHDGNVFARISDLVRCVDGHSESESLAFVGRFFTAKLVKGMLHGVPDPWMPDDVLVYGSETKGEIGVDDLGENYLLVRPGPVKHPHFDTIFSIQPGLMIFGNELNSPELQAVLADCFAWAKDQPTRWAAAAASSLQEGESDQEEDLEPSRNDELRRLFKAGNISEWTTPVLAADKVNAINKATRKGNLALVARSTSGSLMWSMLLEMLPYAALNDLWVSRNQTPPVDLANKATMARKLEAVNAEGLPVMYLTPRLFRKWCKDNPDWRRTVVFRRPTGTKSGTLCEVRCLPESLVMFEGEERAYFVPTEKVFELVWKQNEGGDLDDEFVLVRGRLVEYAVRGLAWRERVLWPDQAKRAVKVLALLRKCRDLMTKIESMDMGALNRVAGAEEILGGLFDLTVEQNDPAIGEKLVRRIVKIQRKAEPKEEYLGDIPNLSRAHILSRVLNMEENPFAPLVGMAANAQMWAVGLAIGWVELPCHLRGDEQAIILATCEAMLSDIVDASVKGVEFAAAWRAVEQILLVQLYIDWQTATLGADGLMMLPPLKKRAGRGLKALISAPIYLTRTAEEGFDGQPLYEPAREGRKIKTAMSCAKIESPLYSAWESFAIWIKDWATGQITAVKTTGGAGLLSLIADAEAGEDPSNAERVSVAYRFLGEAATEVKRRQGIFKRMEYGYQRDPLERRRLQAYVNLPTREAFGKIEEHFGATLSPAEYNRLLVGIAAVGLRSPAPLNIEEDYSTGTFRAWGGIPTIVFFTDSDGVRGTWTPLRDLLQRKLVDEEFKVVERVSIRVGKDARDLDATTLVGKNIEEILSVPGLQIAFSAADISNAKLCGARNQDTLAGRLAKMLAPFQGTSAAKRNLWGLRPILEDDKLTWVKAEENALSGKTSWEVAGLLAYQEVVRAVIPGTAASVTVTEGLGLENRAVVDSEGNKTYVKAAPVVLEIDMRSL